MKKKNLIILISIIIVILLAVGGYIFINKNKEVETDAKRFSSEYTQVSENNVFVYRDIDEIINILENGTGVVYLGFSECKWCQRYSKYLNEVALDMGISKIYYFDIREDRKNNTEEYQKIVSILSDYLQYDDEGNKRVYVPTVVALKKGEIVGFDDETSYDTKGFDDPKDYWTDDEVADLKEKLEDMIAATGMNVCTECE